MILIADSGSTKCDWLLQQDDQPVIKTSTVGLNPHILSAKQLRKVIKKNRDLALRPYISLVLVVQPQQIRL